MSAVLSCSQAHYVHPVSLDHVEAQLSFLEGKVLTVIDAAISGTQNKAAKDLVRAAFREQLNNLRNYGSPSLTTASGISAKKVA